MALFEKKDSSNSAVSPEEAECDKKLAELARNREETVRMIGLMFLESSTPESVANTPYKELVDKVAVIDKETVFQEKRKLAVKGLRKCEKCGNILVLDSSFCNKCGEKLEPLFVEEIKSQNICPQCGATYAQDAVFCISCGCKLK